MQPNDIVMIYEKPITQEDPEGEAKLISVYRKDTGDGLSMWEVEFLDEPGKIFLRTVSA